MPMLPIFDDPFLRAQWDAEFLSFQNSPDANALLARLRAWAAREQLTYQPQIKRLHLHQI